MWRRSEGDAEEPAHGWTVAPDIEGLRPLPPSHLREHLEIELRRRSVTDEIEERPAKRRRLLELGRIVVAGEMLELGEQGAQMHYECGQAMAAAGIDFVVGVRGLAQELVTGAREAGLSNASFCETPEQAAEQLIAEVKAGDLVLVKGSRGVRTEGVVERLQTEFGGKVE